MLGKLVAVSFAVMVTALLVTSSIDTEIAEEKIPVIAHAQTTVEENSSTNEPYTVYEDLSDQNKSRIKDIGFAILQLQLQNDNLTQFSTNQLMQDMIKDNNEEIDKLFAELDMLWPDVPVVEVSAEDKAKMNAVIWKLVANDLPLIGMGIDGSTGMLDIIVDIDRATPDIEQKIREIAVGVEVDITYDKNTAVFQSSSCDRTTEYCDPIIGGSKGEDEYWGQDCTISIAAVRNTGSGTENGIVIPDHCNKRTTQYYQSDNDISSHLVGRETKDGG